MDATLERLQDELREALGGLDGNQTQMRPARRPEAWTVQQIVEHLLLTYATTEDLVRTRLEKGTPTKARPTPMQRLGQFTVTALGYFPGGRVAPAAVMPGTTAVALDSEKLRAAVAEHLAGMDRVLADAEILFGRGRAVSHIILGPMSAGQWRRFHLVHGRHHAKQIAAIRRKVFSSSR